MRISQREACVTRRPRRGTHEEEAGRLEREVDVGLSVDPHASHRMEEAEFVPGGPAGVEISARNHPRTTLPERGGTSHRV